MTAYIVRRILYSIPLLCLISFICFVGIDLPPGDFVSLYIQKMTQQAGLSVAEARHMVEQLREKYGLNQSFFVRFGKWFLGILQGDFGYSLRYNRPVLQLIGERLGWTVLISIVTMLFSLTIGIVIGIYSAVRQYSIWDYILTIFSFLGVSTPNFLLALAIVWFLISSGWESVTGLFSPGMVLRSWSWAKFMDFLRHLWIPVVVIGTAGLAGNIRVMRANLLDVLKAPYIQTARSKGLHERVVIYKHAVRNALHPLVMSMGMSLPWVIEGTVTVGIVLSLPVVGPMFYRALTEQDMYLAGAVLFFLAVLTMIGNLLADIALVWLDPRVRYD